MWLLYRKTDVLAKYRREKGPNLTLTLFCDTVDTMPASDLNESLIRDALTTVRLGHPVYYWPVVSSTMDEARRLAQRPSAEVPDGALLVTDEQTSGRGRLQRSWWAPPSSSLLLSLIFRPPLAPHQAQRLTIICSLAVCEAISKLTGLHPRVKWPNDVLINERKVCGILTELDVLGTQLNHAIVGIGINVNMDFRSAPSLMSPATSLLAEIGHPVSRLDLLVALMTSLERYYSELLDGRSFRQEWASQMATLGEPIEVTSGSEHWAGVAVDVDLDGALLVRKAGGNIERVLADDVTLRSSDNGSQSARNQKTL